MMPPKDITRIKPQVMLPEKTVTTRHSGQQQEVTFYVVDGRPMAAGVRRASVPGGHDVVVLAEKRTVDRKEGEASANESSISGESSLPTTVVVSAGGVTSGSVGLDSRSRGGQRETAATAAAKAMFQGPNRVAVDPRRQKRERLRSSFPERGYWMVNSSELSLVQGRGHRG